MRGILKKGEKNRLYFSPPPLHYCKGENRGRENKRRNKRYLERVQNRTVNKGGHYRMYNESTVGYRQSYRKDKERERLEREAITERESGK